MKRGFWFSIGNLALGAAIAGAALPLLPTTPFLLVAAFAFARSSPRMHQWLIDHAVFGPLINDWREHGAISGRAKFWALASMAAVVALSVWLKVPVFVLSIQTIVLLAVGIFILSRPSGPRL